MSAFISISRAKFVHVLATVTAIVVTANSYAQTAIPINAKLTELFQSHNVVYLGENHITDLHRKFMPEILESLVESGVIDAFATEAVFASRQDILDEYLLDQSATVGSALEKDYFRRLGHDMGWFLDIFIWNQFRKLRDLKLKHGEKIRVCGVDIDTHEHETPERQIQISERLNNLDKKIKKKMEDVAGITLDEIIATHDKWDREVYMALATVDCVKGKKTTLVQVGAKHGWSLKNNLHDGQDWWAMSTWQKFINKTDTIVSVAHGTTHISKSDSEMIKAHIEATKHFNSQEFVLSASASFPPDLVDDFTLSGPPYYKMADYWIFGPFGEEIVEDQTRLDP